MKKTRKFIIEVTTDTTDTPEETRRALEDILCVGDPDTPFYTKVTYKPERVKNFLKRVADWFVFLFTHEGPIADEAVDDNIVQRGGQD